MSAASTGIIRSQNKPKIVKAYARATDTDLTGLVFEYEDGTRTMLVGPPSAAGSTNVNPIVILESQCENIPGVTEYGIQLCKIMKTSGAAQVASMPGGFDRLEWGYYGDPTQYGYSLTDLNFYKNGVLVGELINAIKRRGSNRKDLKLPAGHVANGMSVDTYTYGDYWPYNFISEIYGMADPNVLPVPGGWSAWGEWSECPAACGQTASQHRDRTCDNPAPFAGGASCAGEAMEHKDCNGPPCPVDGGWGAWPADWGECIKNAEGVFEQEQIRMCDNPAPKFGGKPCVGTSLQLRKCIPSQVSDAPVSDAPASDSRISVSPISIIDPGQISTVASVPEKQKDGIDIKIILLILCVVAAAVLAVFYTTRTASKSITGGCDECGGAGRKPEGLNREPWDSEP